MSQYRNWLIHILDKIGFFYKYDVIINIIKIPKKVQFFENYIFPKIKP